MKLKIRIDEEVYEVDVEVEDDGGAAESARSSPRALPISSIPFAPAVASPPPVAGPTVFSDKVCRSPISGIVVRINVHHGQQIKMNDPLVVLEAMKMETNITAPVDGVVKNVTVAMGQAVQGNQVVVELE